jgi:hypothetical protein
MRRFIFAALLGSMAFCATPAGAQRPISISLGGGASLPEGSFGHGVGTGWHALGALGTALPMLPMGLRLDGAYNRFDFEGGAGGQRALASATLNLTYRLPSAGSPLAPYVIAGFGAYHSTCEGDATCESSTPTGWNAGLGTKLMIVGLRTFLEARYHSAGGNASFFPLTVGVTY